MLRQREQKRHVTRAVQSWECGYHRVRNPDVPVMISIDAFNRLWSRSDQYIEKPGDEADDQPERYANVGQRIMAGEQMLMSVMSIDADGSMCQALRQSGVPACYGLEDWSRTCS